MEFVYVVKRGDLFDLAYPQGFQRFGESVDQEAYLTRIREKGFFVERRHAEQDSSLKQIIPYCVVTKGSEVLLLRRTKKQGEARLHKKLSIGVGGHINPVDQEGDLLHQACKRELHEEIHLDAGYDLKPIGILNDDSTEVGSVHFGLVQRVTVRNGKVGIRETEMMEGSLVPVSELQELDREDGAFETWSSFLVKQIDGVLGAESPSGPLFQKGA